MKTVERFECKCNRCGHEWVSQRSEVPVKCPNCGSAYWNRARVQRQRRDVQEQEATEVRSD